MSLFKEINNYLSKKDKLNLFFLLCFSIFVSAIETLSIAIIMPFISVATNFDLINNNIYYKKLYMFLGCHSPVQFVIVLGILLAVFFIFKSGLSLLFICVLNYFAQSKYHTFVLNVFNRFLDISYRRFTTESFATINKAVFSDASSLSQILTAFLQLASEMLTAFFIYIMLLYVNWKMTLCLTCLLLLNAYGVIKFFSRKIAHEGKQEGIILTRLSKLLNESFGNFKLIKLLSNKDGVVNQFDKSASRLVKARTMNKALQDAPRVLLEVLGFLILVGIIIYIIWAYRDPSKVLSIVSIYALAFYKFLPSVSKILAYYNLMVFSKNSLGSFYLDIPKYVEELGDNEIGFDGKIEFKAVAFRYEKFKKLLDDVNFVIQKGEKVAFVGESGSGKSTLLDLVMGFYQLDGGQILIDNNVLSKDNVRSWRKNIGYIPQEVYLLNGSVAENVVFGRKYDKKRLIDSLKQANIYDFLLTKDGIETKVGEDGIMFSGGQKQRIAIARALYSDPDVLILDEATSALDNDTESKIMEEVYNLKGEKTLIIVAHRLSTVARCEKIYKVENGCVCEKISVFKNQQNNIINSVGIN
jgi:ATP-binding cassette, subfamily B, bacterial PglK